MNRANRAGVLVAAAGLGLLSAGCYSNYPVIESSRPFGDVNILPNRGAMVAAGRWAMNKYAQGQAVVFNLPTGLTPDHAREVVADIGPGAAAMTKGAENAGLTFHIVRVWLRNDRATVDILVPGSVIPGATASDWRTVKLMLQGGPSKYTVVDVRVWETAIREVPPPNFIDAPPPAEAGARHDEGGDN